jgi:hypothetical protein
MDGRRAWPILGAAVLSSTVVLAQSGTSDGSSQTVKSTEEATSVTLVGCLQRENDYRKANDIGRAGAIGLGLGSGDEFVLANASAVGSAGAQASDIDCSSATTGDAYELTGKREDELKSLVGHVVQITGIQKKAEVEQAVGTSGANAARPTGGVDPLKRDLRLFEVEITSFQEVGPASAPAAAAPAAAAPAAAAPTAVVAEAQPTGTSGTAQELPRTASPLPFIGLLGLLSLTGGLGLRLLRN